MYALHNGVYIYIFRDVYISILCNVINFSIWYEISTVHENTRNEYLFRVHVAVSVYVCDEWRCYKFVKSEKLLGNNVVPRMDTRRMQIYVDVCFTLLKTQVKVNCLWSY